MRMKNRFPHAEIIASFVISIISSDALLGADLRVYSHS